MTVDRRGEEKGVRWRNPSAEWHLSGHACYDHTICLAHGQQALTETRVMFMSRVNIGTSTRPVFSACIQSSALVIEQKNCQQTLYPYLLQGASACPAGNHSAGKPLTPPTTALRALSASARRHTWAADRRRFFCCLARRCLGSRGASTGKGEDGSCEISSDLNGSVESAST
jgi:hypothetical protein